MQKQCFSALVVVLGLLGAACGDDDGTGGAASTSTTSTTSGSGGAGGGTGGMGGMGTGGMGTGGMGTGGAGGGMGGAGGAGGGTGGAGGGAQVAAAVPCQGATIAVSVDTSLAAGFAPNSVTINAGEVIKFDNLDVAIGHTSTSGTVNGVMKMPDGLWNVPIPANGSACLRVDVAGTYPYYCDPHFTTMKGTVIVQ